MAMDQTRGSLVDRPDHTSIDETVSVSGPPSSKLRGGAIVILAAALLLIALAGIVLARIFYHPVDKLTMTTGSFSGANYALVSRYLVPAAQTHHLDITMVQTGGSEDTLNAVNEGRVQVAIADGGLRQDAHENIREVMPLFLTGLHVLMKREIYEELVGSGDLRSAFRGKTVSMSNPGSGTRVFAIKELRRFGINATDFTEMPRSVNFLVDPHTPRSQIPDIVFAASLLPSPVATRLVQDFDYRLLPLDYVDAVRLSDKTVYGVTIPEATYGLSPDVPERTVNILGYRLLLVAHKDVPDAAILALTRSVMESDFAKAYDPPLTMKQFELLPEYPRHPGAQAYVASREPIKQEDMGIFLQVIIGAAALACFPPAFFLLRDGFRRFRMLGRATSIRAYIAAVSDLEAQAFALDESSPRSRGAYLALRRELNQLKLQAMDAFQRDLLDDTNLMPSFLAHVSDLRNHLNTLLQGAPRPIGDEANSADLVSSLTTATRTGEPQPTH